jgi:hypothetical protein
LPQIKRDGLIGGSNAGAAPDLRAVA